MMQSWSKAFAYGPTIVPLIFVGETLPTAIPNVAYSQNIAPQASGGAPPYTFTLISQTGPDNWFVSTTGVITGMSTAGAFRVTNTGAQRVINTGDSRIT